MSHILYRLTRRRVYFIQSEINTYDVVRGYLDAAITSYMNYYRNFNNRFYSISTHGAHAPRSICIITCETRDRQRRRFANFQYTSYSVQCIMHGVQCTVYIVRCIGYCYSLYYSVCISLQCIVYIIQCTMYSVNRVTLHNVQYTAYTVQCTAHSVHHTLYSVYRGKYTEYNYNQKYQNVNHYN